MNLNSDYTLTFMIISYFYKQWIHYWADCIKTNQEAETKEYISQTINAERIIASIEH